MRLKLETPPSRLKPFRNCSHVLGTDYLEIERFVPKTGLQPSKSSLVNIHVVVSGDLVLFKPALDRGGDVGRRSTRRVAILAWLFAVDKVWRGRAL